MVRSAARPQYGQQPDPGTGQQPDPGTVSSRTLVRSGVEPPPEMLSATEAPRGGGMHPGKAEVVDGSPVTRHLS